MKAKMSKSLGGIRVWFDEMAAWATCENTNDIQSLKDTTEVMKHKMINYVSTELDLALSEFVKNELKNID